MNDFETNKVVISTYNHYYLTTAGIITIPPGTIGFIVKESVSGLKDVCFPEYDYKLFTSLRIRRLSPLEQLAMSDRLDRFCARYERSYEN